MHHRLVLAAIACLCVTGCAGRSNSLVDHDPYNEPQTVYIWDGQECTEATKTAEELHTMGMSFCSSYKANGQEHQAGFWAKQSDVEQIMALGGSIQLPNGETVTFPGIDADGTAVASNGRPHLKNGQSMPIDPAIPDGTEFQVQTFDRATLLDPQTFAAEKAAFHSAQTTAAKDGLTIPPKGSVNGRVGSVSMSYGMGQISK